MKTCPQCHTTYSDESLNFCLADGAVLSSDPEATLISPPRRAAPATEVLPGVTASPTRTVPLSYVLIGLAALLVGGGAVALYTATTKNDDGITRLTATPSPSETAQTASEANSSQTRNQFPFNVNKTGSHFYSGLALVGGYEISIPGDDQWYDTKILIRPSYQLQLDFAGGASGPVNIQVGDVSGFMENALKNGAWYEYNFVARLRKNNPFDHVLSREANLRVRSGRNVFIKVDVRQGDLY